MARSTNHTIPRESHLDEDFYSTDPVVVSEWSVRERLRDVEVCLKSDSDVGSRLQAINDLQTCVLQSNGPLLITELDIVLSIVDSAMSDPNFQILQGGLEVLESLIQAASTFLKPHLSTIVVMIMPKMGGKYVVRQSLTKISLNLMEHLGPDAVISELMSYGLRHKASKVREDVINIVIATLLKYPRTDINLLDVAKRLAPSLVDSRQRIRQAALEAFAVLAHVLGKGNVQPLVSAVSSVEKSYLQEVKQEEKSCGLMAAFQARLSRRLLPSINSDGLVDHAIHVAVGLSSAGKTRSLIGDDVDWILQGSISANPHQSSPTGDSGSRVPSGVRPYHSTTRNRLPWEKENSEDSPQKSKKLPNIPPKPKKSLPPAFVSLGGGSKRSTTNSYAELHRARLRMKNMDQNQLKPTFRYPSSVVPLSNGDHMDAGSGGHGNSHSTVGNSWLLSSAHGVQDSNSLQNSGLSLTWPAPSPDSIGKDSTGVPHPQRPTSKPRVKHPLSGAKPKSLSTSDAQDLEDVRGSPGRRVDTYDDDFEDIYEDEFEGNSLSSSISSLAVKELREAAIRSQQESKLQSPIREKKLMDSDATSDVCVQGYLAPGTRNKLGKEKLKLTSLKGKSNCVKEEPGKGATSSGSSQEDVQADPQPHIHHSSNSSGLKKHDSFIIEWTTPTESQPRTGQGNKELTLKSRTCDACPAPQKSRTPNVSPAPQKKTVSLSKSAKGRLLNQKLRPFDPEPPSRPKRQGSRKGSLPVDSPVEEDSPSTELPTVFQPHTTHGLVTPPSETDEPASEGLQPLAEPEQALKDSLHSLSSGNWEDKVESMMVMCRLSLHHCDVVLPQLSPILLAVTAEVKNLRSAVSRAAIECLGDLFLHLKSSLEPHLEMVVKALLHRTGGANSFLREACEGTLRNMVLSVNHHKSLVALVTGGASHKNATTRRTTAQFIYEGVELMGGALFLSSPKEILEVVVPAIAKLLGDSSPEARYYCRKALNELSSCPGFEKVVSRVVSPQTTRQIEKAVDQLKKKGVGAYPGDVHSARARSTTRPPSGSMSAGVADKRMRHVSQQNTPTVLSGRTGPKKRQRSLSDAQAPLAPGSTLAAVASQLTANEWTQRYQAITDLEELVKINPMAVTSFSVKVFDAFTPRLSDPNVKVNLHALQAFANMVPLLSSLLGGLVWPILSTLPVTSKLPGVAPAAGLVLDLICQYVDPAQLIQPLTNLAEFTNAKSQMIFISKINELLPHLYQTTPTRVHQHVLPLVWHLLESKPCSNPDLLPAIRMLCRTLHQEMGKTLLDKASALPQETLSRLQDFLRHY